MSCSRLKLQKSSKLKNCKNHKNFEIKPSECYSNFIYNGEEYAINELVIINKRGKKGTAKLKCMFIDKDDFDEAYVILQDSDEGKSHKDSIFMTELTSVQGKCCTSQKMLDTTSLCEDNLKNEVLSEMNFNSPVLKVKIPLSNSTQTPDLTSSTPVKCVDENRVVIVDSNQHVITPRKNSVKRNLNVSFNDVFDYSIVEATQENSLKMKLRKSSRLAESDQCFNQQTRRSSRNIPRKSYADYISPFKTERTPSFDDISAVASDRISNAVRKLDIHLDSPTYSKNKRTTRTNSSLRTRVESVDEKEIRKSGIRSTKSVTESDSEADDGLDESFRTAILRINLKKLNLKEVKPTDIFDAKNEVEEIVNENIKSNVSTPKLRRTRAASVSDVVHEPIAKTPKSSKKQKQLGRSTANSVTPSKTPRNRAKLIRDGIITPSMQNRSKAIEYATTPLMTARSQLHVSYVPKTLPCREKEYTDVYGFLRGKLLDGCGGSMYISGVPGTGKTATVTSVINSLQQEKSVPSFTFINVNGMRLTEPRQSYVEILKQLTGKCVPWEQAQSMLEDIFLKSKKQKPIVMLIDELDILCTKRQDVVYNLLDWPTKAKNQLIVITIANTMDLPERLLMSRVTSRLGLTRLTFQAYTYKQLQEIVTMRLCGTETFNPDAVQLVARKVASVSGDARRALDICRRAAEIAEAEGKSELVNMTHVNEALSLMITQPKLQAIRHCSFLEQLILQAIVSEVERTGVEETNFKDVYKTLFSHAIIEGFDMVSTTVALTAVAKLGACRLILTDPKCNNIHQRIVLNVSSDDIFYALKNE